MVVFEISPEIPAGVLCFFPKSSSVLVCSVFFFFLLVCQQQKQKSEITCGTNVAEEPYKERAINIEIFFERTKKLMEWDG